ncbi:MAG: response regulator [Candidatus Andersenbacteria bacterium]|nr:response regulator [Candidatus Andersenbacteria bacterium]MBI3251234.1 response regulator [Candidatus Andersenbacteria bacterium]
MWCKQRHSVVVADPNEQSLNTIKEALIKVKINVLSECKDGTDLLETCMRLRRKSQLPDLILADLHLPPTTCSDVAVQLADNNIHLPVLSFTGNVSEDTAQTVNKGPNSMGILIKPIGAHQLMCAIQWAIARYPYIEESARKLQERITIEQGKDALMELIGCTGAEAMRTMRRQSQNSTGYGRHKKNLKLFQVAEIVLETHKMISEL